MDHNERTERLRQTNDRYMCRQMTDAVLDFFLMIIPLCREACAGSSKNRARGKKNHAGSLRYPYREKRFKYVFHNAYRIDFIWIKDSNVKDKAAQLLGEMWGNGFMSLQQTMTSLKGSCRPAPPGETWTSQEQSGLALQYLTCFRNYSTSKTIK